MNTTKQNALKKPLVIYHSPCSDGLASAWVVYKKHPDWEFLPQNYGMNPFELDVEGRDVYLLDFSFDIAYVREMLKKAKRVIWIDHHSGAEENLRPLINEYHDVPNPKFVAYYRTEVSGCLATWDFFNSTQEPPLLLKHVSDRDLWNFFIPNTKDVISYLYYKTTGLGCAVALNEFDHTVSLCQEGGRHGHYDILVKEGRLISEVNDSHMKSIVNKAVRPLPDGTSLAGNLETGKCLLANVPSNFVSEAGSYILGKHPEIEFVLMYSDNENHRDFSLRSRKGGRNIKPIAQYYGGNGHENAAGFRVNRVFELAKI